MDCITKVCFRGWVQAIRGTSFPNYIPLGGIIMHTAQHGLQQANQCRQIAQQLIQQTQQSNQQYRQMLHQEQQNIQMLEQILQREKQAAQVIEHSLHGHELAIQRCQEVVNICNQIQHELTGSSTAAFGFQTTMKQPINTQNQYQTTQFSSHIPFQQQ
jgi:hypothetical protein